MSIFLADCPTHQAGLTGACILSRLASRALGEAVPDFKVPYDGGQCRQVRGAICGV